jgi:hypothetical protein
MKGARILVPAAAALLGAMIACSSFSATDDAPDAGAAADTGAAADAGTDAVNLLSNGEFEHGCSGWGANNALLTANADPSLVHGGAGSCLVCTTAGDGGTKNELFVSTLVAAPPKAQFYAGAWLRSTPARAPLPLTVHLDVTDRNGAGLEQGPFTPAGPLTDKWQKATALVDVTAGDGGGINIYFTGMESGKCYLIDDAWLYQLR